MTLTHNDLRVRIFVDGTWVDVTERIRQDPEVSITTGKPDESKGVTPGVCHITFDNEDGWATPRNPLSPYSDLGRFTPICVMLDEVWDYFERVSASGLGTTDSGETWSSDSFGGAINATDYSVDGHYAKHLVPSAVAYRMNLLMSASGAPSFYNGEVLLGPIVLNVGNVTGGAIEPGNVILRAQSTSQYYQVRVTVDTAEAIKIALFKDSASALTSAVSTGFTHAAATPLWVRGGAFDGTIYGKVWQGDLDDEPEGWQVEVDDTSYTYGYYGFRTGVATGNTNVPVTVSYGGFVAYPSQFNGEVPEWPQEFSDDGVGRIVPIEAGGVLRRWSDSEETLGSSLRRFYTIEADPAPVYYWALDGGKQTDGAPVIGTRELLIYASGDFGVDPSKVWGEAELSSWLPNGMAVGGFNAITNYIISVDPSAQHPSLLRIPVTTFWAVDFVRTGGAGTIDNLAVSGASQYAWAMVFSADLDQIQIQCNNIDQAVLTPSTFDHLVFDDGPHHFRLTIELSGSDQVWSFYVDGVLEGSGVASPAIAMLTTLDGVIAAGFMLDKTPRTGYAHIALFTDIDCQLQLFTVVDRFEGSSTEGEADRFKRLCDEEGVSNFMVSPVLDTIQMGPQFPDTTLVEALEEIERTGQGFYRELLSARALHYDPLARLFERTVSCVVDVGAGHLMPPFKPVDDDQQVINRAKVSKREGRSIVFEQPDGRLGSRDPKLGGAGPKGTDVKTNPYSNNYLTTIAERVVAAGTVDESRFPTVAVNIMAPEVQTNLSFRRQVLNVFVSTRIQLTNMGGSHVYRDSDQLVIGMARIITPYRHEVRWTCIPFAPYRVFVLDTDRLDAGDSSLNAGIDDNDTTLLVDHGTDPRWVVTASEPAEFPFEIEVGPLNGGEIMSCTAIVGTGAVQTFTVVRNQNGLPTAPSWPAGTPVRVNVDVGLG